LELVCCEYSGLEFSQEVDTFTLEVGDTIEGGEVFENGRQTAFDLIKNIRRLVGPNAKYANVSIIILVLCILITDHDTKLLYIV
jgi:hypothetical protein